MEGKGSEPGLASKEPSFSSYCSKTAETAARVSMEEQHRLDYDFEFDSLSESDNNVFAVFNKAALLLEKQVKVEATKKDYVSPPSLDVKKPEGAHQTVHYKKSNPIGSSSRWWSFTRSLRRSNSELGAPTTRTNNNTEEEEKGGDKLGRDRFIHNMCPCPPILEEADEKELVVMETKISSKSLSTLSDGSNKRVFPVPDPKIVPLDKREHDHVEVMKEQDDSTTSDVDKLEGVKYKKSKSTGTLSKRWSFKGLLRRSSSERGPSRSTKNTEEGVENTSVFSRCFSLPSRSSSKISTNLEEGEKYKKRKSTGTLSTRWSFKDFLRRSSSECGTPRSTTNNTKEGVENTVFSRCFSLPSRSSSKLGHTLEEEGEKYKKSKSVGTLSARWSLKGLPRRSSSERGRSRITNNTEDGMQNIVFSRCFSLPSRSSSKVSINLEVGEKLGSDGCIFYLCPCLLSPPTDCTQPPKEADQDKVFVKEKKPSSKCSTGSDHESKNNNHADLGKVDGFSKRPKLQSNAHKVYLKKNTESPYRQEAHNKVYWKKNSASPYRREAIGFFAMVRPLVMLFTT